RMLELDIYQFPLISRHEARSQRGGSVVSPPGPPPPLPPATSNPRSRFGRVGIPTPRLMDPMGRSPTVSSLVSPSPSLSKYDPPALVPVKALSALMKPEPPASHALPLGIMLAVTRKVETTWASCTMRSPLAGRSMYQPCEPAGSDDLVSKARSPAASSTTATVLSVKSSRETGVPSSMNPYMLCTDTFSELASSTVR